MANIRRVLVIFVIAILFTIFINVTIEAVYPNPEYDDYCEDKFRPPEVPYKSSEFYCSEITISDELMDSCEGKIEYTYNSNGCPIKAYCETCHLEWEEKEEMYNFIVFIISTIAGLAAIIVGINLPEKKNPLNEWVGSGFLLGGLLTIFIGTARFFGDMGRFVRPIIILLELSLVIYLTYKKLGGKK